MEVEAVIDLPPKLGAAAIVVPAVEALEVQPERHGREVLRRETLAGPEIGVGVVHLDGAGGHGIEAFVGGNQLASTVELDRQPLVGHRLDAGDEVFGAARAGGIERGVRAVGAGHLPGKLGLRPCNRRRGDGADGADGSDFREVTSSHDFSPLCCRPFLQASSGPDLSQECRGSARHCNAIRGDLPICRADRPASSPTDRPVNASRCGSGTWSGRSTSRCHSCGSSASPRTALCPWPRRARRARGCSSPPSPTGR